MIVVVTAPVVDPPPTTPPGPEAAEVSSLQWRWTSWDGRYWNLTDWSSPVIKLKGASGWNSGEPDHWWQESPSIDGGGAWDGLHIGAGAPFLPVMVRADSSMEFMTEHQRFIKSLNPRQESVMRVTRPDGTWRERTCRYVSGKDLTMNVDPVKSHRAVYGITWAADPYWSGEPVEWSVEFDTTAANFYPGPPFTLAPAQLLGDPDATVDNEGDVDAFPVWRIDGPFDGFTAGVGDSVVTSTLTKPFGGWVEIDMRPSKLTVLDEAGVDQWPTLTEARFSSIPPGTSNVVTTSFGSGAGSKVTLSFRPRYEGFF